MELKKTEVETNRAGQIWLSFVEGVYEPLKWPECCRSNQAVLPLDFGRHNERGEQVACHFITEG